MCSYKKIRSLLSRSCICLWSFFSPLRNSYVSNIPQGSSTQANRQSRTIIIMTKLINLTIIPVSSERISTWLSATTTVSLANRFSHSPKWTALMIAKSFRRILCISRALKIFSKVALDSSFRSEPVQAGWTVPHDARIPPCHEPWHCPRYFAVMGHTAHYQHQSENILLFRGRHRAIYFSYRLFSHFGNTFALRIAARSGNKSHHKCT